MMRTCDDCGGTYDDVYRLTYCPHEKFDMATSVYGTLPDGRHGLLGIATTLTQARELMEESRRNRTIV